MRYLLAALIGIAVAWSAGSSILSQGPVTVSGRLFDPDGKPSAAMLVDLCEEAASGCLNTQTDADGRFQFNPSPGSYLVAVVDPLSGRRLFYLDGGDGNLSWESDHVTRIEVGSTDIPNIEITLPSPTEVSGLVLRADDGPQAGVFVLLCEHLAGSCREGTTDRDGRFSVVVPRGDYHILIDVPLTQEQGIYGSDALGGLVQDFDHAEIVAVRAEPVSGIEMTLRSLLSGPVHGSISLENGYPTDDWRVQICGHGCRIAESEGRGNFRATAVRWPAIINVLHGEEIVGRYQAGSEGNFSEDLERYTTIEVPIHDDSPIDIRIPSRLAVFGRAQFTDGTPIVGWNIQVCPWIEEDDPCSSVSTHDGGLFALARRAGDYHIQLQRSGAVVGYYSKSASGNFSEHRPDRARVNLDSSTGDLQISVPPDAGKRTLSGRALRWDGLPDIGVEVTACRSEGWGCPYETLTDDQGRFEFEELPPDQYQLLFVGSHRHGYYAVGANNNYTEDRQQATRIDLTRTSVTGLAISRFRTDDDRPHVISGTLLFADGAPAHSWWVQACSGHPECAVGGKLPDGRFAIQVAAGDYELRIRRDSDSDHWGGYVQGLEGNYSSHSGPYTSVTVPSDDARDIEIRLPVRTWFDINLRPGPGASFSTEYLLVCPVNRQSQCERPLAPGGPFKRLVLPGDYYISIRFTSGVYGYYSANEPGNFTWVRAEQSSFTVPEGEPTILTITVPAQEKLRINVVEPDGALDRYPDLFVSVCPASDLSACAYKQNAALPDGQKGQFLLQRPAGSHYIRIRRTGYALGSGSISWYVSDSVPGGLVQRRADASIFPDDHVHPDTRVVTLPDIPRTVPVQIELQPGVNLIGAPAGGVAVSDLFAQAEQLVGVILLPHQGSPQQVISRSQDAAERQQAYLGAGRIAWMYVSEDAPITLRWNASVGRNPQRWSHRVYEPPGWVIWQSRTAGTVADVARGLTHLTEQPGLIVVEGGSVKLKTSGTVRQGDVIWVESPIPFQPLPRDDIPPNFSYTGRNDLQFRAETERTFHDVIGFFWSRFGLEADALSIGIYAETETPDYLVARCGWAREHILLACVDGKTMAREYARALQYRIGRELASPGWLVEGAVEYAALLYRQHATGAAGDPIAEHRAQRAQAQLADATLTSLERAARHWRPVDIPMSTTLSTLAVDWLVTHAGGYEAIWTYFHHGFGNLIDDSRMIHDWQAGFEAAFGLPLNEFYERFAQYRANGFRLEGE